MDELRVHLNSNRTDGQPKLTYLPFIMQALVKALGENPVCNALFDDEKGVVTRHDAVHLGIATQTDRGLYVPVVKHVEAQDIWQSASEMQRSAKLLETELGLAELTGSTFTITSLGRMGGLEATPIINKPEVGILEVHRGRYSSCSQRSNRYSKDVEIVIIMGPQSSRWLGRSNAGPKAQGTP